MITARDNLQLDPARHYELVVLTPVYNQADFIERFISHNSEAVDGLVVLDDGSSDGTYERIRGGKVLFKLRRERSSASFFDDRTVRSELYEAVLRSGVRCSWLLWLDSDELLTLDPMRWARLREFLRNPRNNSVVVKFPLVHLLDDELHIWADYPFTDNGLYLRPRMFRANLPRPRKEFQHQLHFSPVPFEYAEEETARCDLLILHFGNITSDARRLRYERYLANDPYCRLQPCGYEHLAVEQSRLRKAPLSSVRPVASYAEGAK